MDNIKKPTPETDKVSPAPAEPAAASKSEFELGNVYHGHQPVGGSLKRFGLIAVLLLAVAGAGAAAWMLAKPEQESASVTAKKDVELVRYGSLEPLSTTFYPGIDLSSFPQAVNHQVFEGLTGYVDNNKIVPVLAESWTNPDDVTWVFKLKPNVKFHTGRTMTAKHVKESIEAIQADEESVIGQTFASTIKSVEVVDDMTVKITTNGPDPILVNELTAIWVYDTESGQKNAAANGTGPYQLKTGTEPTETKVELIAYDEYHGGRPTTRALSFESFASEEELAAALTKKEIQIAVGSDKSIIDAGQAAGYEPYTIPPVSTGQLVINSLKSSSPLAKLKVRQAIAAAINQDELIKNLGLTAKPTGQIVTEQVAGYNPDIKAPVADVTRAKALLTEAGYPKGITITLTYFVASKPTVDEIIRQLALAGITVKSDMHTTVQTLGPKAVGGTADMYYNQISSDLLDASDLFRPFVESKNYQNSQVIALQAEADKTLNQAQRLKLLQQITKILSEDVASVPLFTTGIDTYLVDPTLAYSIDYPPSFGVNFWKVYQK